MARRLGLDCLCIPSRLKTNTNMDRHSQIHLVDTHRAAPSPPHHHQTIFYQQTSNGLSCTRARALSRQEKKPLESVAGPGKGKNWSREDSFWESVGKQGFHVDLNKCNALAGRWNRAIAKDPRVEIW